MKVVAISDLHCGSKAGLAHPGWFRSEDSHTGRLQREMYSRYELWTEEHAEPDVLLVLGDCIDGKGERSGGTELLTTDRREQCNLAIELLDMWKAKRICMVYGTPYHTGNLEDWERTVADALNAEIHGQMFVEVEDVMFHLKHKIGSSSIPHGRHTAVARERVSLMLWEDRADWPKANVILRGHVHYHNFCGGPGWLAMTLPALQAPSTKYGSRQCSGVVDWGIVTFDVDGDSFDYREHTVQMAEARPAVVKI